MISEALTALGILTATGIGIAGLLQARGADARAAQIELRQQQRADVSWDHQWRANAAALEFRNIGTDPAHQVEIVVDPIPTDRRRTRRRVLSDEVGAGDTIAVDLDDWVRSIRGYNRAASRWPVMQRKVLGIHARVTWHHAATGMPGVYEARNLEIS